MTSHADHAEQTNQLRKLCEGELHAVLQPYDYIRGVIFAVAAAPEIPLPDTWLVWVFRQRGQLSSVQQADKIADVLMKGLQQQLMAMRNDEIGLVANYSCPAVDDADAPICLWLTGLLETHAQLEPVWQEAWQNVAQKAPENLPVMQKDLTHCLSIFSTFANVPLAVKHAREKGNYQLEANLSVIFPSLDNALQKYVQLSGLLVAYLPDQFETFTQ